MVENLLIASAWTWGVHGLFVGLFLKGVGKLLERTLGTIVCTPLFKCPPCMASVHGIPFAIYFYGLDFKVLIFVICLIGLNYAIKEALYPEYEETSP